MPDLRGGKVSVHWHRHTNFVHWAWKLLFKQTPTRYLLDLQEFSLSRIILCFVLGVSTPEEFKVGFILLSLDGLTLAIKCCSRQAVGWRRRGVGWVGVNSASLLALPPTFLLDPLCLPPQRCQFYHVIFVAMLHVKLTRLSQLPTLTCSNHSGIWFYDGGLGYISLFGKIKHTSNVFSFL